MCLNLYTCSGRFGRGRVLWRSCLHYNTVGPSVQACPLQPRMSQNGWIINFHHLDWQFHGSTIILNGDINHGHCGFLLLTLCQMHTRDVPHRPYQPAKSTFRGLVESNPRPVRAVLAAKGGPTQYWAVVIMLWLISVCSVQIYWHNLTELLQLWSMSVNSSRNHSKFIS